MIELTEAAQTVELRLLILAFLILTGPIIAERLRLPGLIGLISLGMVFGPFVMGWVTPGGRIGVSNRTYGQDPVSGRAAFKRSDRPLTTITGGAG